MASSSDQLQNLINLRAGYQYTKKTDDEIAKQAAGEYQSYYDKLRLAAQQQQERSDLRLAQQASALQATYDKQREANADQYRQAYSQTDRQILRRGMQRSSYALSTLNSIKMQEAKAAQTIGDAQAAAEANIQDQRTQLAEQLAAQLAGYDANQAADILNRERELKDKEYEREQAALQNQASLEQNIYNAMYQQERAAEADRQYIEQFQYQQGRDAEKDRQYAEQFQYQQGRDAIADQRAAEQLEYQKARDAIADAQWQQQFEESQRQFDENLDYQKSKKSGGGGGGGSKSTATEATTLPTGNPTAELDSLLNSTNFDTKQHATVLKSADHVAALTGSYGTTTSKNTGTGSKLAASIASKLSSPSSSNKTTSTAKKLGTKSTLK